LSTDIRYILYFGVTRDPFKGLLENQIHTCWARYLLHLFPRDRDLGDESAPRDIYCETDSDSDMPVDTQHENDMDIVPDNMDAGSFRATNAAQSLPRPSQVRTQASGFVLTVPSGDIWADSEIIDASVSSRPASYTIDSWAHEVARAACGSSEPPNINITASSVAGAARMFLDVIQECRLSGDYTRLVGSYGHRSIVIIPSDESSIISSGPGVVREVLYHAWESFIAGPRAHHFLAELSNNFSTLSLAPFPSSQRENEMQDFGAMAGLLIAGNEYPVPLAPSLLRVMIAGGNLGSLTRQFVAEWFPLAVELVDDWHDIGLGELGQHQGIVDHFIEYSNIQVDRLQYRDHAGHSQLGALILAQLVLFGSQIKSPGDFTHPDLTAFATGFSLTCSSGFSLTKSESDLDTQAIQECEGGADTFISTLSTSSLQDISALLDHMDINLGSSEQLRLLRNALSDNHFTFHNLLKQFFIRSGPPAPGFHQLMLETGVRTSTMGTEDDMYQPIYRAKVWLRAATGSPIIDPRGSPIE
ncbi:hypothetical protein CYLTODRAFT_415926, partial [Cylindrobasidium torrendii FP15055 ss-10]